MSFTRLPIKFFILAYVEDELSVDAIIISPAARYLQAFTPADFPSANSIRYFHELLKNNNHLRGRPKQPFFLSCLGLRPGDSDTADAAKVWWRMSGSNRRPPACKAGALPAELIPHDVLKPCGGPGWIRTNDPRLIKTVL